jgi:hypothetical protein
MSKIAKTLAILGTSYLLVEARVIQPSPHAVTTPSVIHHPAHLKFAPEAGKKYAYRFERAIELQGLQKGPQHLGYRGKFVIEVVSATEKGFEADLFNQLENSPKTEKPVFHFFAEANGEKLEIYGRNGATESEGDLERESIAKDLLSLWLFPLHEDTVGAYESEINALSENRVEKKKSKYLGEGRPEIVESNHQLRWNLAENFPEEISGLESTRMAGGWQISSVNRYRIALSEVQKSSSLTKGNSPELRFPASLTLTLTKAPTHARDANGEFLSVENTLSELAHASSLNDSRKLALFGELISLLRTGQLSPEDLADRAGASGSSSFKLALGALASFGSPKSQAAVVGLYNLPDAAVPSKGMVLTALTTTQASLSPETQDFLISTAETETNADLAHGAEFALGSSLKSAPAHTEQEIAALSMIHDDWQTAHDQADRNEELAQLDVMGNSGRVEFLPSISDVISESQDPWVKAKAVFSLRFINDPSAIQMLSNALTDPAPQVRERAAQAIELAPWHEAFQQPLSNCKSSDPIPAIRNSCASTLSRNGA